MTFPTKNSLDVYLSPPGVELGVSKDCHFWNIIMYWNGKLESLMNCTNITYYIKKSFKQKLFRIKFPTKDLLDAYLYLPQKWSKRAPKIVIF